MTKECKIPVQVKACGEVTRLYPKPSKYLVKKHGAERADQIQLKRFARQFKCPEPNYFVKPTI